ncbi:MAG: hypothetical protein PHD72_03055 [Patescibacteria group bacterium]|nr:hypothetical protein [Patescibacteria group bacterium]
MRKHIKKVHHFVKRNWKVLGLAVLLVSCFSLAYFFYSHVPLASAESNCALTNDGTGTMPLPNTTFIKSYRLLVFTKVNGAWPTKDGGYIISGITDPNIMFVPPDGFVAKLDKQGAVQWLKFLKTTNSPGDGNRRGEEDVQSIIELKSGGYLMASKVWGFIKTAEWSAENTELNKIMFTRLDKNGRALWSKSFTAFVEDAKNSLLETADNGFLFYANTVDLAPDDRGEDSDVYQDMPFASLKVLKFDLNGNLQWSKNVKNFISRENDSYLISTPDGGYALAGNVAEPNSEKTPPYDYDSYPGLVKFDKDFNFAWAKSLEGTPLEMVAAVPKAGGGFELGHKQVRQGASLVKGLVRTPDNGYLVLGTGPSALSLVTNAQDIAALKKSGIIGFKFDSLGNLEWVKKMSLSFNDFTVSIINFSVALLADNKILFTAPLTWADDDYAAKFKQANAARDAYCVKYQISEEECQANIIENIEDSKQTESDWAKVHALFEIVQDSFRPGIFVMKTDQELNASWAKIVNPQRGATNYVAKATADNGAIVAGEYVTKVVKSVILDSKTYYKDGFLIKMDASGNVRNNNGWITNYNGEITTEMKTAYSVSNNLSVQTEPWTVELTKRQPEFSLYTKGKTYIYAPYLSAKTTPCPLAPTIITSGTPAQNSTGASTAPKTWPQINFEKASSVEPVNDKSRSIHNELLPILNQLYNNQVKLTDNMGGSMLSYAFDRVVIKDDMTAVKKHLEGLGYKTQDEGTYQLTMYKVGYFLNLTFSINNFSKGFLNVTY